MSHTNSTTNYGLPQFLTGDKPAWLTDVNNAFSDLDTAVYAAQSKADTAFMDAGNAQSDATTAINSAAAADAKGSGALASIEAAFDATTIYSVGAKVIYNNLLYRCIVAITTPGPWTGSANWERITVDSIIPSSAAALPYAAGVSTADAIADLETNKQARIPMNVVQTFESGTSIDALNAIIAQVGKVNMQFSFAVFGIGHFFGFLNFYNENLGGGLFVNNAGRAWVITYSTGTITLTGLN